MSRAIITGADAPANPAPPAGDPKPAAAPAVPAESASPPDALAGALPDWDLLPGSPFIRRVK